MTEIYVETVDEPVEVHHSPADQQLHGKLKELYDELAAAKEKVDADKETAAEEPSDSKKLDLLGGLGVAHAENQIELHREMRRVHVEVHGLRDEVRGAIDAFEALREDLNKEFTRLTEATDALLLADKEAEAELARAELAREEEPIDASDTVIGRAWGFAVRCAGIGILIWLIAVAIIKVFPEGV